MKISIKLITVTALLLLFSSCGQQEFATPKATDQFQTDALTYDSSNLCTGYTHIKPPVDILFLWDNSSSQYFVTPETKKALNNTINYVSSKFDYHILLAPLIKPTTGDPRYLVAATEDSLTTAAKSILIPQSQAQNRINFAPAGASSEAGAQRAIDIINQNRSNGIFRQNAHTIVVVMSNGDDNSYSSTFSSTYAANLHITSKSNDLINLRDNVLHAHQLRFISLVAFTACQTGFKQNYVYREIAKNLYRSKPTNGDLPTDQDGKTLPDSYNICTTDFNQLFDGVNNSITDVLLKHVYNYWPIGQTSEANFDPGTITVSKKVNGQTIQTLSQSSTNGFQYVGYRSNQNTRIEPSVGEPYTGYMIKLNGTGQATYPECVVVKTQRPASYYGYIQLHSKPLESTIKVTINGNTIQQSTANGWNYVGYSANKNIKIKSPTEPNVAGTPAENYTGYFLQLHGDAIYTNGADIKVIYDPAPTI